MNRRALPAKSARWNAADYAAHSVVQLTWARELIARLNLRGDEHILDVGCGDGKVTAEIARAVQLGRVVGIDASAEMIAFARQAFPPSQVSNLKFQICDARRINPTLFSSPSPPSEERAGVRRLMVSKSKPLPMNLTMVGTSRCDVPARVLAGGTVAPPDAARTAQRAVPTGFRGSKRENPFGRILPPALFPLGRGEGGKKTLFDIIFSNAALHWVDDHLAILRGMASVLKPGGRLIVSCGGRGNAQDVFLALRPEMRLKRWRGFFRRMPKPYFFYAPEDYERWLPKSGFKIRDLQLAPKDATYAGAEDFAAWLRTTWLPYVQRMPEDLREEFIAAVTQRYLAKHPPDAQGKVHVRMVRLEIDAVKL